jgi:HD-like signal output (HDOD) protein
MKIFPILLLVVLVVLLIVSALFPERKGKRPSSRRTREAPQDRSDQKAKPSPEAAQGEEAPPKALLKSYPALKSITELPMVEGWAPTPTKEVNRDVITAVKQKMAAIKPMPANHVKLMNLLRNPESNPTEITSLTTTNPVFSARILRAVNAAYFNRPEKISSVGRAITLLGYNVVRALVLQETLANVIPEERFGNRETYTRIWAHSAVVSACAGYLGKNIFQFSEYELGTMGLLHDIGKYFIRMLEPQRNEAKALPLVIREELRYGINHASLGGLIAINWRLSDTIAESIEYHHHPSFCPPESIPPSSVKHCFVICLSDLICNALGYSAHETDKLQIRKEYYDLFKLQPDLQGVVTPRLVHEIERAHATVQSYILES